VVKLGVTLFACTIAVLVAEFFRRRTRGYPAYGWIGLGCLAVSQWLMFHGVEPVATFFTPIAWTCYALIADAAVFAIRSRSRIRDTPAQFAKLALLSIPLWLIFEAYNLRLKNWTYGGGIPLSLPVTWLAYAWAFATIWPGIFLTADLVESFGWWQDSFRPIRFTRATQNASMIAGAALVIVPVILPAWLGAYLFAAVWVGFVFLLDPINLRRGLPSFEADLSAGQTGRFLSFLVSGWVCGWLWEFWNYWASQKWNYTFPIMQGEKIFEMPALGYLGFLPFALECFVMYYFAAGILRWEKPLRARTPAQPQPQAATAMLKSWPVLILGLLIAGTAGSRPADASSPSLAESAKNGLQMLYAHATDRVIPEFLECGSRVADLLRNLRN